MNTQSVDIGGIEPTHFQWRPKVMTLTTVWWAVSDKGVPITSLGMRTRSDDLLSAAASDPSVQKTLIGLLPMIAKPAQDSGQL